jgi:hypothetical protein
MGSEKSGRSKAFFVSNAGLIEAKIKRRIDYLKHNAKDTIDALEYTLTYMEHCNKFHSLKKLIASIDAFLN